MKTNISKETIVRTVVLAVTLLNTILTQFNKNPLPFSESDIYQIISTICTVSATIWAWWKNNSFTKEAIEADRYKDELKKNKKSNIKDEKEIDKE